MTDLGVAIVEPIEDADGLVGPPVDVTEETLEACRIDGRFGALLFELYKEACRLICVSSNAYCSTSGDSLKFDRNQAICAGLMVRISKLMFSVAKLTADIEHGETVEILNRCIIESVINLRYLLLKDDDNVYDRFVKNSLVAERELRDMIQGNVKARGGETLAIEASMLRSIEDACQQSGVMLADINQKAGSWGGSFRDRLTALGYDWGAYTTLERIPSHAIHGDWVDLVKNHLLPKDEGFEPNSDRLTTDGKLLSPIGMFAIEAAREYLDKYFDGPSAEPLRQRLNSLQKRLFQVEYSRKDWEVES